MKWNKPKDFLKNEHLLPTNDGMMTDIIMYEVRDEQDQFMMEDKGGAVSESDEEFNAEDKERKKVNIVELNSSNCNNDKMSLKKF